MKTNLKLPILLIAFFCAITSCSNKENDPNRVGRILFHETKGDFFFLSILKPDNKTYLSEDKRYQIDEYTYSYGDFIYKVSYLKYLQKEDNLQIIQNEVINTGLMLHEIKNITYKEIEGVEISDKFSLKKRIYAVNNTCYVLSVTCKYFPLKPIFDDPNIDAFFNSFYINDQKVDYLKHEMRLNNSDTARIDTIKKFNLEQNLNTKNKNKVIISGQRIDEEYQKVKNDLIKSGKEITEDIENNLKYIVTSGYGKDGSFFMSRYNFNKNDICENISYATNSFELISSLIEHYNRNYVAISTHEGFIKTWVDAYGFYFSYKEEINRDSKYYYIYVYKME